MTAKSGTPETLASIRARIASHRTHGIGILCPQCGATCNPGSRTQDRAGFWRGRFDCPVCDDSTFDAIWFPSEGEYSVTRTL